MAALVIGGKVWRGALVLNKLTRNMAYKERVTPKELREVAELSQSARCKMRTGKRLTEAERSVIQSALTEIWMQALDQADAIEKEDTYGTTEPAGYYTELAATSAAAI